MESVSSTQWFMLGVLLFFALARIIELFVSKGTADQAKERGVKAQKEPIFSSTVPFTRPWPSR